MRIVLVVLKSLYSSFKKLVKQSMARTKQKARRSRHRLQKEKQPDGETPKADQQDGDKPRGYTLADKHNEAFELYYKAQHIVPKAEWDDFMEHLRKPLPVSFRVAGFRAQAKELVNLLKSQYLPSLNAVTIEGRQLKAPKCLSWYPEELAWQLNLERGFIRKNDQFRKLHEFLVSETESGSISRQEAVSMIPPLMLDVKPHHKVLDMCAAPGSKTAQLIEMLHGDENIPFPEGFVVANDSDNKRCYLMVHQVKRLESPNFVIINHDASHLPNLWTNDTNDKKGFIRYDRVLCDVPCTGDGTMRKNVDVWTKWNLGAAANLHGLQYRILKRGLELLTVGGRLVYSTCSFNPIENEAVVANMLDMCKGAVHLVDVSDQLPGLKRTPGMNTWKVMHKNKPDCFDKFEDVPEDLRTQIRPGMFPPAAEKQKAFHLNRCIRVLPHHQDTGGFFVAVLEKTSQLAWIKPSKETEEEETGAKAEESRGAEADKSEVKIGEKRQLSVDDESRSSKKQRTRGYKEDPFIWLSQEEAVWPPIKEFYGLKDEFNPGLLMVRCTDGKKRNIYYTSEAIKNMTTYSSKVKFINMGVKLFCRSDSPYVKCDFRLVQNGIATLYPFIKSRTVEITPADLVTILSQDNPYTGKLTDTSRPNVEALDQGGCIFVCKNSGLPNTPACDIILTGWKGRVSCRSFLRKFERSHFLRLFGHELQSKNDKKDDEAGKSDEAVGGACGNEEEMDTEKSGDVKEETTESGDIQEGKEGKGGDVREKTTGSGDMQEGKDAKEEKVEKMDTAEMEVKK